MAGLTVWAVTVRAGHLGPQAREFVTEMRDGLLVPVAYVGRDDALRQASRLHHRYPGWVYEVVQLAEVSS